MSEEDELLERISRQIADAITQPSRPPSPELIERYRLEVIESARRDPEVISVEVDPDDPWSIKIVHKLQEPVRFFKFNLPTGAAP
jgi:hypothetical protein